MANDGGPAFPFAAEYGHPAACGGMSLRDWFAGMAISGTAGAGYGHEFMAERAYLIADAMLAERERGK